jgi:hypothetical protein
VALAAEREGEATVIYSGIWGWWVPEAMDFVEDVARLSDLG